MLTKIKKLAFNACALFTFFTFLLYIVGYITVGSSITLTLGGISLLLGLCILLCILNKVLYVNKLSLFIRIILHYLLVLSSSFFLFGVIGKIVSTSLASLFMLAVVTLIYSLIALAFMLTRSSENRNEQEYTSMFKK